MERDSLKELGMASQAVYTVFVKGKLNEDWAEWFGSSTILIEQDQDGNPVTTLTCHIKDQAELLGILIRLNSLSLPLFQVVLINNEGETHVSSN